MHPRGNSEPFSLGHDRGALAALAHDHQRPRRRQRGEGADQPRQVLDRAQPGQRAQPQSSRRLVQPGQPGLGRTGGRRRRITAQRNPVGNAPQLTRPGAPGLRSDCFEHARRHHQRRRSRQGQSPKAVADRFERLRLILIEAVFVVHQRWQAQHPAKQPMRANCVHRSPIVRQHQIEPAHRACNPPPAARAGFSCQRRKIAGVTDPDGRIDRAGCAQFAVNPRDHDMVHFRPERIHQLGRAQFFAAGRKGRMEVQQPQPGHGGHTIRANSRSSAAAASGSFSIGA